VTVSAKTRIVRMLKKKTKFSEITNAKGKYSQELMGPGISQGSFKSTKTTYIPSYSPGHGQFENSCFVAVAYTVSVSCAFVYNAVDVNKIITVSLAKLTP